MPRTVAIIQARMGSTRLPGKVLADIAGMPMLQRVVERVHRVPEIDTVAIASTHAPQDVQLLVLAEHWGAFAMAGSEEDVLDRYLQTGHALDAEIVVRITADCPVIDPAVVSRCINQFHESGADFGCNHDPETYPRGMEVELFRMADLEVVADKAREPYQREHVTPYFYESPGRFTIARVTAAPEYNRTDLRLCVDTQEDLDLIRILHERLGADRSFALSDMITCLDGEPGLAQMNQHIRQKHFTESGG
jgi:spore coat polysaccharide biosynthesis protein SpsF